jgi:hypothetical protein
VTFSRKRVAFIAETRGWRWKRWLKQSSVVNLSPTSSVFTLISSRDPVGAFKTLGLWESEEYTQPMFFGEFLLFLRVYFSQD